MGRKVIPAFIRQIRYAGQKLSRGFAARVSVRSVTGPRREADRVCRGAPAELMARCTSRDWQSVPSPQRESGGATGPGVINENDVFYYRAEWAEEAAEDGQNQNVNDRANNSGCGFFAM